MTRDELIDYTEWLTQNPVIREWTLSHPISIEIIEANVDRYLAERGGKKEEPSEPWCWDKYRGCIVPGCRTDDCKHHPNNS